jgi:hypothetical protein
MPWRGVFRLWRHPSGWGGEGAVSGWAVGVVTLLIAGSLVALDAPAEAGSGPDIVVVGGPGVVSPDVVAQLMECTTGTVRRYSGADRYSTAAALSSNTWASANQVYLATGAGYADAVAAGPVAGMDLAPVLLTRPDSLPGATASEILRLGASEVVMIGGPAAIHPSVIWWTGVSLLWDCGDSRTLSDVVEIGCYERRCHPPTAEDQIGQRPWPHHRHQCLTVHPHCTPSRTTMQASICSTTTDSPNTVCECRYVRISSLDFRSAQPGNEMNETLSEAPLASRCSKTPPR